VWRPADVAGPWAVARLTMASAGEHALVIRECRSGPCRCHRAYRAQVRDGSVMSAGSFIPDDSGFPVRWFGEFPVAGLPSDRSFLTAQALAGELCAVLDEGAAGLIVVLPGAGVCDAACLEALMRAARRARGWGSWLRLVIPDAVARRAVRLVALDEVMPVYASVNAALAAAACSWISPGR
jgi:anti-sigma B factor antagonist